MTSSLLLNVTRLCLFYNLYVNVFGQQYVNELYEKLEFECGPGEYLEHINSKFTLEYIILSWRADRRWDFGCTSGLVNEECEWSDFVNDYDQFMNWKCPDKGIVVGAKSEYLSKHKDRIWKFKCCQTSEKRGACKRKKLNNYDEILDFYVPANQAIYGFQSVHSDSYEDRIWTITYCEFLQCKVTKTTILSEVSPTLNDGVKQIQGIAITKSCPLGKHTTELGSNFEMTETTSLKTTRSSSYTYSKDLSVGFSSQISLKGIPLGELSLGYDASSTEQRDWSWSKSEKKTIKSSTSSSQKYEYQGPGAAMIIGYVTRYKINYPSIDVENEIKCSNGVTRKERTKAELKMDRYAIQADFTTRKGSFYTKENCEKSEECLHNLNGQNAVKPGQLEEEFDKCIQQAKGDDTNPGGEIPRRYEGFSGASTIQPMTSLLNCLFAIFTFLIVRSF